LSFILTPYEGTAQEVVAELATVPQNVREEEVLEIVKKSIAEIVTAVGGYISVTGNGHLNSAAGETGDSISITIVSLPVPASVAAPVEATPTNPEAKTNTQIEQEAQDNISVSSAEATEIPPGEPTTVAEVESTQESPAPNSPTEVSPEIVLQNPPVETAPAREEEHVVPAAQLVQVAENLASNETAVTENGDSVA
jgi:hypothetical protein